MLASDDPEAMGRGRSPGGANAAKLTALDGNAPKRAVVQVWDSMEKIQAWRDSPEWKELCKTGEKYAKFRSFAIEGLPQ
jgi:heme-degrading monooxygenase HmoA